MRITTEKRIDNNVDDLIIGMDEAGRGPVIGPLIIGIAITTPEKLGELGEIGVMDSKILNHRTRILIGEKLESILLGHGTLEISAAEIDENRESDVNLNQLEIIGFRELLGNFKLNSRRVVLQLDAADVIEKRFGENFTDLISGEIISKHGGDALFPAVSAASILAKNWRDNRMEQINQEMRDFDSSLPKVGSGYPNQVSNTFLEAYYRKYNEFPNCVRKSWNTTKKVKNIVDQSSIDDFF